ncbi:MAG: hypothetical protein VYC34_12520 [Planctomycetota bacterium]|nr:hypothetical protein [Planctomycetota bacterium]
MVRILNMTALVALGSLWAGILVVIGAMLVAGAMPGGLAAPQLRGVASILGLTFLAAGEFVFLVLVADRLFPKASPRLTRVVEAAVGGLLLFGVAGVALNLLTGAGS